MTPNIEALYQVCRVLDRVDPREFDMTNWRCGTVACALGHSAADSWFNQQGFCAASSMFGHSTVAYQSRDFTSRSWEAVEDFFSLPASTCHHLFLEHAYQGKITKERVIGRIKQVIASLTSQKDEHVQAYTENRLAQIAPSDLAVQSAETV